MHCIGLAAAALTRRLPFLAAWIVVLVASLVAVPALADPGTEAAAKALQKKAIEEDFLNLDYPAAIKKLQGAAAKCGADKCSPPVKGAILRDLGAMQVLAGNEGDGRTAMGQALALDSTLDLDPSYKNPQLEAVWNDVKKKAPAAGGGGGATTAPLPGPPPAGDFAAHRSAPRSSSAPRSPSTPSTRAARPWRASSSSTRAPGMGDWKPLELKKTGDAGWGGLVPCKDVTQGTMSYYIQGFNAANDPGRHLGQPQQALLGPREGLDRGRPPGAAGTGPAQAVRRARGRRVPAGLPRLQLEEGLGRGLREERPVHQRRLRRRQVRRQEVGRRRLLDRRRVRQRQLRRRQVHRGQEGRGRRLRERRRVRQRLVQGGQVRERRREEPEVLRRPRRGARLLLPAGRAERLRAQWLRPRHAATG